MKVQVFTVNNSYYLPDNNNYPENWKMEIHVPCNPSELHVKLATPLLDFTCASYHRIYIFFTHSNSLYKQILGTATCCGNLTSNEYIEKFQQQYSEFKATYPNENVNYKEKITFLTSNISSIVNLLSKTKHIFEFKLTGM